MPKAWIVPVAEFVSQQFRAKKLLGNKGSPAQGNRMSQIKCDQSLGNASQSRKRTTIAGIRA
jgi:hypothetical protein